MPRWTDYTQKQTPSEADEVMLLDSSGRANKRTTLRQLARTFGGSGGSTTEVDDTLTQSGKAADSKVVGDQLEQIRQQLKDLQYIPIEIRSFSNNIGVAEIGHVLNEVTLTWELNKDPETVTLNGQTVSSKTARSAVFKNLTLTENKTFTLMVTDDRGSSAQKSTTITFYNGVYYGASAVPTNLDSSFIRTLTKSLQSGRTKTFSVNSGADQYIWYALPARYGTPVFNVGGFDGGFTKITSLDFMNLSGYTEKYDIYRSDYSNIGKKTIKVT